jgi:agmatinase
MKCRWSGILIICVGKADIRPLITYFAEPGYGDARLDEARIVIIPAPLEYTTCYGQGTRGGPAALLAASTQIETYDEELDGEPLATGVATHPWLCYEGLSHERALAATEAAVAMVVQRGQIPLTIGGEHSLMPACLRAVQSIAANEPLGLVAFDAHADMRESYEGTRQSHACALRRALEIPGVRALALGVRSISPEEVADIRRLQLPLRIVYAHQMHCLNFGALVEDLPERVYVSIDLDVFDPGIMPAVGTPEPGGLGWYELLEMIRLVGVDVVELMPLAGLEAPNFLAAKLVFKIIGALAKTNGASRKEMGGRHR